MTYVASALATAPAATTSSKYLYIPSHRIITELEGQGFTLHSQREARTRKEEHKGHTKHVLTFRQKDDVNARKIGDATPQIGIINSHNGAGSLRVFAGLFRFVCTNGLVVGDTWDENVYPHRGNSHSLEDILGDVFGLVDRFSGVADQVRALQATTLTPQQRLDFAEQASRLRWEEGKEQASPQTLLRARRGDDQGSDAWSTFNVVQENLIKGGLKAYNPIQRRRSTIRAITGLDEDLRINRELWQSAVALVA